MANASQFIGSKISLISKAEIKYEGILYTLDVKEATISLAKVRAYGTENRPTDRPVAPRDDVYDFIVFRGTDIKSIDVVEPPKAGGSDTDRITIDPAVIEVSQNNSRSQSNTFPPFNGAGSGQNQRQNRQRNFIEGLLRRAPRQADRSDGQQAGNGGPNQESGPGRDGRFRGGSNNGREPFPDFRGRREYNFSPRGGNWGNRGGYRRPQGMFRQPAAAKVKFENDFDFEKSNEELLPKIKDTKPTATTALEEGTVARKEAEVPMAENQENKDPATFYSKEHFFDAISCEALERAKGPMVRPDWRQELKLNAETFGLSGQRRGFYRGGATYYGNGGGYDNRWSYNSPRGGARYNWYNGQGQGRGVGF